MILKLKPLFYDKVWGGHKLKDNYGYDCSKETGEAWGISGHKSGSSIIINGEFARKTLRELYSSNKELFGNYPTDEFPILIKLIDANDDLSVQVHPNDEYAGKFENSLGKTECWYILDTEKDTEILIGHKAKTLEEFKEYFQNNRLDEILNKFPINKDDHFNVYSGTIHAICKGTVLLEIQQSSDVTYRLYDYNRLHNGELRELHVDKALDVIKFPDDELNPNIPKHLFDFEIRQNQNDTLHEADVYGDYLFIMEGSGTIDNTKVKKGDFIFITSKSDYEIQGEIKYFFANIK